MYKQATPVQQIIIKNHMSNLRTNLRLDKLHKQKKHNKAARQTKATQKTQQLTLNQNNTQTRKQQEALRRSNFPTRASDLNRAVASKG